MINTRNVLSSYIAIVNTLLSVIQDSKILIQPAKAANKSTIKIKLFKIKFLMHIPYILEPNPHPILICTQFLVTS
jgi:hypothetical protein